MLFRSTQEKRTHIRLFWSIGWNRFFPPFNSKTSKCNLRYQLQATPLLIFLARNANQNPSSETSRPIATSSLARPLCGPTYSTLKFMRSTCGKSKRTCTAIVLLIKPFISRRSRSRRRRGLLKLPIGATTARRRHPSRAPYLRKFGSPSI